MHNARSKQLNDMTKYFKRKPKIAVYQRKKPSGLNTCLYPYLIYAEGLKKIIFNTAKGSAV